MKNAINAVLSKIGLELIDDVHKLGTYSSTWVAASGAFIAGLAPVASAVWLGMPDELKAFLPSSWKVAISIIVLCSTFIAARATQKAPKAES